MPEIIERQQEMPKDGLIQISDHNLKVTEKGRSYARNIAMAFDLMIIRKRPQTRIFSMTV
jgi:oxygen-independent coproporphyrinogen-3 oxidase